MRDSEPEVIEEWRETLTPLEEPLVNELVGETTRRADPPSTMILRSAGIQAYHADTLGGMMECFGADQFSAGDFTGAAKVKVGIALKSAERDAWMEAIRKEIFSHIDGGTLGRCGTVR